MADPLPGPIDWLSIDRFLMRELHYRPWELLRMTVAEVCVCLEDHTQKRPPGGVPDMGDAEMMEYARRYASMTVLDRLRAAREGRL